MGKGRNRERNTINVVDDQFRSPTLAEDLAKGCISIMDKNAHGLFHLSGPTRLQHFRDGIYGSGFL